MATSTKSSLNLICPCCGQKMRRRRWDYVCSDEKCGFVVKRTYHGHDFTDDELGSLVNDGMQLELTDCTDKNGLAMPVKVSVDRNRKSKDGWAAEFYPHVRVACCLCGQEQFYEYPDYFQCRCCGLKIVKTLMKKSFSPAERLQLMEKGYLPKAGDFYRNNGTELQTAVKVDPVNKILMLDPGETGAEECRRREAARLEQLTQSSAPEAPAAVSEEKENRPPVQSAPDVEPVSEAQPAPSLNTSGASGSSEKTVDLGSSGEYGSLDFNSGIIHHKEEAEPEKKEKVVDLSSSSEYGNRDFNSGIIHHKEEAEPEKKEKVVDLSSSSEYGNRDFNSGIIHHKEEAEPEKKEKVVDLATSNDAGSRDFNSGIIHHKEEAEPEKKEKVVDLSSSSEYGNRNFNSGIVHHREEAEPEKKEKVVLTSSNDAGSRDFNSGIVRHKADAGSEKASAEAEPAAVSSGPKDVEFAASSAGRGSFLSGISHKSSDDQPKRRVVSLTSSGFTASGSAEVAEGSEESAAAGHDSQPKFQASAKASFASGIKRLDSDSTLSERSTSKSSTESAAEAPVQPVFGTGSQESAQAADGAAAPQPEPAASEEASSEAESKRGLKEVGKGLLEKGKGLFGRFIHKGRNNG